jgi:PadR family transcriptional regulator PadR
MKGRGRTDQLALRRLEQKLTKENLWIYILHLLRAGPLYAYEIRDKIRAAFGFEPATITVYVVLYKMEREGLVTSATEKRAPSNMVRRYYSLTEVGLQALEEGGKMLRRTLDLLEVSERSVTS